MIVRTADLIPIGVTQLCLDPRIVPAELVGLSRGLCPKAMPAHRRATVAEGAQGGGDAILGHSQKRHPAIIAGQLRGN